MPRQFRYEKDMLQPVLRWLEGQGFLCATEAHVWSQVDILAGRFGSRPSPGRRPPILELVVVELKLQKISEVYHQCRNSLGAVHRVYAAMPAALCSKMRPKTLRRFSSKGIGLLAVREGVHGVQPQLKAEGLVGPLGDKGKQVGANLWRRVRKQYRER